MNNDKHTSSTEKLKYKLTHYQALKEEKTKIKAAVALLQQQLAAPELQLTASKQSQIMTYYQQECKFYLERLVDYGLAQQTIREQSEQWDRLWVQRNEGNQAAVHFPHYKSFLQRLTEYRDEPPFPDSTRWEDSPIICAYQATQHVIEGKVEEPQDIISLPLFEKMIDFMLGSPLLPNSDIPKLIELCEAESMKASEGLLEVTYEAAEPTAPAANQSTQASNDPSSTPLRRTAVRSRRALPSIQSKKDHLPPGF